MPASTSDRQLKLVNLSPNTTLGLIRALRRWNARRWSTRLRIALILGLMVIAAIIVPPLVERLMFYLGDIHGVLGSIGETITYLMILLLGLGEARRQFLDLDDLPELTMFIHETWHDSSAPVCYGCGYDLRGSDGMTCPECGEPIPKVEEIVCASK